MGAEKRPSPQLGPDGEGCGVSSRVGELELELRQWLLAKGLASACDDDFLRKGGCEHSAIGFLARHK